MNFLFISPNYPPFFYKFCAALKNKGVRVFGVGDSPEVLGELKQAVQEYHIVPNIADFSVLSQTTDRIIANFGALDGVDSLNEYWLETESKLRERYGIAGASGSLMQDYKFKSRMKARFAAAGVAAAPFVRATQAEDILNFALRCGFPLFCKPDNGVGAGGTHKLCNREQLLCFLQNYDFSQYIFEPYVHGDIYSFDGLCDKDGDLVFCACHQFFTPIDLLKENGAECVYCTLPEVPPELFKVGTATVKAFELKNSFFHIEFFKLLSPISGVADTGSFVALETNMRIAGGYTAEMLYHALGLDIYGLWAAVVCGEKPALCDYQFSHTKRTVVNVARKTCHTYQYTTEQLKEAFNDEFILCAATEKEENPFGNLEIIAAFRDPVRLNQFVQMAVLCVPPAPQVPNL